MNAAGGNDPLDSNRNPGNAGKGSGLTSGPNQGELRHEGELNDADRVESHYWPEMGAIVVNHHRTPPNEG